MTPPTQSGLELDRESRHKIDLYLEDIYGQAKQIGESLAKAKLKQAQMHGLETIVSSTTRFSEILNYIKNQAGKEKSGAEAGPWRGYALTMLDQLKGIEDKAKELGGEDSAKILDCKLRLVRGWARQVATSYRYAESLKK